MDRTIRAGSGTVPAGFLTRWVGDKWVGAPND